MSFTTKKYTRPVLVQNVKSLNVSSFTNVTSFANALSPRTGRKSAQFNVLKATVGRGFLALLNDKNLSNAEKKGLLVLTLNS
jgi:hypothetical protein